MTPSPNRAEDGADNIGGEPLAFKESGQAPAAHLRFEAREALQFLIRFLAGDIDLLRAEGHPVAPRVYQALSDTALAGGNP